MVCSQKYYKKVRVIRLMTIDKTIPFYKSWIFLYIMLSKISLHISFTSNAFLSSTPELPESESIKLTTSYNIFTDEPLADLSSLS